MGKTPGFSVVEAMIYLALSIAIISFLYLGFVTYVMRIQQAEKSLDRYARLVTAVDLCVRDLQEAPTQLNQWKKISLHELIWHTGQYDCGWRFHGTRFERLQGIYLKSSARWKKLSRGLAVEGVDKAPFSVSIVRPNDKPSEIGQIHIEVISNTSERAVVRQAVPRNRKIL